MDEASLNRARRHAPGFGAGGGIGGENCAEWGGLRWMRQASNGRCGG